MRRKCAIWNRYANARRLPVHEVLIERELRVTISRRKQINRLSLPAGLRPKKFQLSAFIAALGPAAADTFLAVAQYAAAPIEGAAGVAGVVTTGGVVTGGVVGVPGVVGFRRSPLQPQASKQIASTATIHPTRATRI